MKRSVCRWFAIFALMGLCSVGSDVPTTWASENDQNSGDAALAKVDAALNAYETLLLGYEIINLGSDEPVVLMDSLRLVEKYVG